MRVLIIGAGIGGASAAIALRRIGADVLVCERAPEPREVGAGIGLGANAMAALRALGAHEGVYAQADVITRVELRTAKGGLLGGVPTGDYESALSDRGVLIHRADLLRALLGCLPAEAVRFGHACTGISQDAGGASATFADGSTERADVVVGADGIRSVVRGAILGEVPPRYSGYTGWRGIAPDAAALAPAGLACEVWGAGRRFGFGRCGRDRVYWYATDNTPAGGQDASDARPALLGLFRGWAAPVTELIRATPADGVLRNDIVDRPPSGRWGAGRVTLLGDAAHPTTPNLGQGGCMAIEDAVALARALRGAGAHDPQGALRSYEESRMARTAWVTRTSWRLGRVAQWGSAPACVVRDVLMRLTPAGAYKRQHLRLSAHVERL